jgi:hypothetical protein
MDPQLFVLHHSMVVDGIVRADDCSLCVSWSRMNCNRLHEPWPEFAKVDWHSAALKIERRRKRVYPQAHSHLKLEEEFQDRLARHEESEAMTPNPTASLDNISGHLASQRLLRLQNQSQTCRHIAAPRIDVPSISLVRFLSY